jgi:cytochrome c556
MASGDTTATSSLVAATTSATIKATKSGKRSLSGVLAQPDYLSELARAFLRKRMMRHGEDLTLLVRAVVLLQYTAVHAAATRILSEPKLARPMPDGQEELNSVLPERFFVLQDELFQRAREVADNARSKDNRGMSKAFGRLTETCVACHAAYLNPAESP